jgi:S1-C subfamily serine protease
LMMSLAWLLGIAGLVALESRSQPPGPRPSAGARPNAVAPFVPSEAPSEAPGEASPTPTKALDTAVVVSSVNKSVVNITSTLGLRNTRAAGTGVILTASGLVLTNNHVIAGATAISGVAVANGRAFQASVVGFDRSHDIAVIQLVNATGLPRIGVGNSSSVEVGDPIIAVGNAGGAGGTPTAVTGSVTALNQSITAQELDGGSQRLNGLIQVAADIRSGDSGGPLVDSSGRLIGINTAASVDPQDQAAGGKGFAIPSNTAVGIAQQIQAGRESSTIHIGPTALLGVSTADADGQVSGAAVTGVIADGPAQRAGVATGDVIRSVDGQGVDSARALTSVLDTHHPGDEIRVAWVDRAGRSRTATVRLAVGPAG